MSLFKRASTEKPIGDSPQVLQVRFGANPNSSSLGVDVTYLLFGGTAVMAISLVASAWLRGRRRTPVETVGEPRADASS